MRRVGLLAGALVLVVAMMAGPAQMPGNVSAAIDPGDLGRPADVFQVSDSVVCEPQGGSNPFHPSSYWYDVTPGDFGRCDFHVRVFDPDPTNYTSWNITPWRGNTWVFSVHPVGDEWWASWWDSSPGCSNAFFSTTRFSFTNSNVSAWGDWTTTTSNTTDPDSQVVDSSGNHTGDPDGYGYRVHVPFSEVPSYKMHYPQWPRDLVLPDSTGIDVAFNMGRLADDWMCTQSGPVNNIYFWVSWKDDDVYPLDVITVRIDPDIPVGPNNYSIPDYANNLWERDFHPDDYTVIDMDDHIQDWWSPGTDEHLPNNHVKWQEVCIQNIGDPFYQEEGTIYWLEIDISWPANVGWKVSGSPQYRDDAVYWWSPDWMEVRHPTTQESLDLAFVITSGPEPAERVPAVSQWGLIVVVLLMLATAGILIARRRIRSERVL